MASTFWTDGYRDAQVGNKYAPPEHSSTSVFTAEYQRGYNAFYDRRGMDDFTWNHFQSWLDDHVYADERDETERGILHMIGDYPELLQTHSWPEIRRMAEGQMA
jgi:hypothetical protein